MAIQTEREQVVDLERTSPDKSWFRRVFGIVAAVCALFVVFTTTAMFLYPGGTGPIASTHGYQFFVNFFSDLGQTRTQSGATNVASMLLFSIAMIGVGGGAGAFFIGFARYFATHPTTPLARRLNRVATWAGLLAAACFAGVGLTPHNLFLFEHQIASQGAFYLLLVAVLLEIGALWLTRSIHASLLWVNIAFVVILAGYVALMTFGPPTSTLLGDEIHVTGQKIIVYTAIATIFSQALLLRSRLSHLREAYARA